MLGTALGSPKYLALADDNGQRADHLKQDEENQTLIELNVNDINIKQIRYLANFIQNIPFPQEGAQGMSTDVFNQLEKQASEQQEVLDQQF